MASDAERRKTHVGSIYEGRSQEGQRALSRLRSVLQDSGFKVEKERATEGTLRVYPERRGRYPLLNPRFFPAGRGSKILLSTPAIVFEVFSDHDESITELLKRLPVSGEWSFKPAPRRRERGDYRLHGRLIVPFSFVREGDKEEIDFESLRAPLSDLHLQLTAGFFGGSDAARWSSGG